MLFIFIFSSFLSKCGGVKEINIYFFFGGGGHLTEAPPPLLSAPQLSRKFRKSLAGIEHFHLQLAGLAGIAGIEYIYFIVALIFAHRTSRSDSIEGAAAICLIVQTLRAGGGRILLLFFTFKNSTQGGTGGGVQALVAEPLLLFGS